ncbi:hypothetical protein JTE90_018750 [Oedothorax gibbosus]|uniref:Uncharacterized protein n=1 Tax=Oedothorax gibbosus TaxID=931172 RepID=A0AAV6UB02_9ARAC|nr:hypothetical protein JTE90_018750 [Oedothorax gibbosus]
MTGTIRLRRVCIRNECCGAGWRSPSCPAHARWWTDGRHLPKQMSTSFETYSFKNSTGRKGKRSCQKEVNIKVPITVVRLPNYLVLHIPTDSSVFSTFY